jgi:hypothetical protein
MHCTVDRIDLNGGDNIEPRLLEAQAQSTRTREQIDSNWTLHSAAPFNKLLQQTTSRLAGLGPIVDRNFSGFSKKFLQLGQQGCGRSRLALPHGHHSPSGGPQHLPISSVPLSVLFEFVGPVVDAGFRRLPDLASMCVPKTPVDKDDLAPGRKDYVRSTR